MVWVCGKNGCVLYGPKGVDGGTKWMQTEVKLGGWSEDVLGQQKNASGGCVKEWSALVHM